MADTGFTGMDELHELREWAFQECMNVPLVPDNMGTIKKAFEAGQNVGRMVVWSKVVSKVDEKLRESAARRADPEQP